MLVILGVSILLSGCERGDLMQMGLPQLCNSLKTRHMELLTQRDAARTAMERDVDLGRHSVPGQTFDAVGKRNAEAYVDRIRDRWHSDDAKMARAVADIDATLAAKGCRP